MNNSSDCEAEIRHPGVVDTGERKFILFDEASCNQLLSSDRCLSVQGEGMHPLGRHSPPPGQTPPPL